VASVAHSVAHRPPSDKRETTPPENLWRGRRIIPLSTRSLIPRNYVQKPSIQTTHL
jgi:hypothetical protein